MIFSAAVWLKNQPSRWPGPDRVVAGVATPVAIAQPGDGISAHAWRLSAQDRRFGGLSALVADGGGLTALTDSGVVVRFEPPGPDGVLQVALHDLPGGPGSPLQKANRDSESLLRDPHGRGWWVGFETYHSLWRFDDGFYRVEQRQPLAVDWLPNYGGESVVEVGGRIAVLPERGGRAWGASLVVPAWTSDATRLPDGRLVLLHRAPTWRGLVNAVWIAGAKGAPGRLVPLGLGPIDNAEGIAAARRADGGVRLWIVSDDNFRPWMRTLLIAIDLPPGY